MKNLLRRWLQPPCSKLEAGTLCARPRCHREAVEQWWPSVCALTDVKLSWVPVCGPCDVALNEMIVRHLFGDRYDAELEAYRNGQA